jgi:protein-S-isoprenylcysteine O-methyltransferase Ste14
LKFLDLPPLWLLVALTSAKAISLMAPLAVFGVFGKGLGALFVLAGLALMGLAVLQMRAQGTSFIPRRDPAALVTRGVFRFSRNPIYLGDTLVLIGVILWWDAPLALIVVPVFTALIKKRFILDEEARLQRQFGPQFQAWQAETGRWITLSRR